MFSSIAKNVRTGLENLLAPGANFQASKEILADANRLKIHFNYRDNSDFCMCEWQAKNQPAVVYISHRHSSLPLQSLNVDASGRRLINNSVSSFKLSTSSAILLKRYSDERLQGWLKDDASSMLATIPSVLAQTSLQGILNAFTKQAHNSNRTDFYFTPLDGSSRGNERKVFGKQQQALDFDSTDSSTQGFTPTIYPYPDSTHLISMPLLDIHITEERASITEGVLFRMLKGRKTGQVLGSTAGSHVAKLHKLISVLT